MIDVEAKRVVACSPDVFLAFVMDIRAYQAVDRKIGRIHAVERDGDDLLFRFTPRLAGLPGMPVWQRVRLTPGRRIDIRNASPLMRWLAPFHGSFVCEPTDSGTLVTRRLRFDLPRPIRWMLDARLRRFLEDDLPRELEAAARHVEGRTS